MNPDETQIRLITQRPVVQIHLPQSLRVDIYSCVQSPEALSEHSPLRGLSPLANRVSPLGLVAENFASIEEV